MRRALLNKESVILTVTEKFLLKVAFEAITKDALQKRVEEEEQSFLYGETNETDIQKTKKRNILYESVVESFDAYQTIDLYGTKAKVRINNDPEIKKFNIITDAVSSENLEASLENGTRLTTGCKSTRRSSLENTFHS